LIFGDISYVRNKIIKINFVYLKKIKIMTKFAENDPERLKEFLSKLDELIEEYHPNIYLLDGVFRGVRTIEVAVLDELNKEIKE